jgi:hypothetical protein
MYRRRISYALFISLLISKLLCTKGEGGWGAGGGVGSAASYDFI